MHVMHELAWILHGSKTQQQSVSLGSPGRAEVNLFGSVFKRASIPFTLYCSIGMLGTKCRRQTTAGSTYTQEGRKSRTTWWFLKIKTQKRNWMSARNEGVALIIWASIMFFFPQHFLLISRCLLDALICRMDWLASIPSLSQHKNIWMWNSQDIFFQKAASMNLNSNFGTKRFKFTFGLG